MSGVSRDAAKNGDVREFGATSGKRGQQVTFVTALLPAPRRAMHTAEETEFWKSLPDEILSNMYREIAYARNCISFRALTPNTQKLGRKCWLRERAAFARRLHYALA